MKRRRWLIVGLGLAVLTGIAVWLWPSTSDRQLPPPRAVVYRDFQACLLTGPQGLADPAAATVWSGMQDASTATRAKVSYLANPGPDTAGSVSPYVATLLQRKCNTVLTIGTTAADVVARIAPQHEDVRFVTVNGRSQALNVATTAADPAAHNSSATPSKSAAMGRGTVPGSGFPANTPA